MILTNNKIPAKPLHFFTKNCKTPNTNTNINKTNIIQEKTLRFSLKYNDIPLR